MAGKNRRDKATGSIYQKGGSYIAQVQDGYRENGLPRYRQAQRKTHAEAVKCLNDLMAKVTSGAFTPDGRAPNVMEWLDRWIEEFVKPNLAPKTVDFYELNVRRIKPYLGKVDLRKVKAVDITKMFNRLREAGATESTIEATRRTFRAAYGVAVKLGLCAENPVSRTFAPKVNRKERQHLTPEQVRKLLTALKESPVQNLVVFCLATGLRIGEATGLTWDDIDVSKTGEESFSVRGQLQRVDSVLCIRPLKTDRSRRTLPLIRDSLKVVETEKARQMIDHGDNPLNLVFLNPYGRPFDPKYVNKSFRVALMSAGLPPMGMHVLRHTAATFMLMGGHNLHLVSRLLGHSQIALTSNLYGHVLSEALRDSAESIQNMYRD